MAFPADKRIYFFSPEESEGDQSFRNTLGGKGANLAEMCVNRLFRRLLRAAARSPGSRRKSAGAGRRRLSQGRLAACRSVGLSTARKRRPVSTIIVTTIIVLMYYW